MAGSTSGTTSSNPSLNPSAPKILLAKPSAGPVPGKFGRGGGEDETAPHRARLPPVGSLNLLSDSWEFHIDRFLPFLTENTDFKVVGIIGPPGAGKSTIMNELYGFDGVSPGMLPPFAIQSEETRAMARHCTVVCFQSSVLSEIMRPDGSSTVSVLSGESLSAELAHEIMNIQVDLLKHGIPDPSCITPLHSQSSTLGLHKEGKDKVHEVEEYIGTPVFVHTNSEGYTDFPAMQYLWGGDSEEREREGRAVVGGGIREGISSLVHDVRLQELCSLLIFHQLQDQDLSPPNIVQTKKALLQYFGSSSFMRRKCANKPTDQPAMTQINAKDTELLDLLMIPYKNKDDSPEAQCESYVSSLWKLRDQVLSMNCPSFTRNVSERDWLKSSAKIWELVKSSPIIAEYSRTLLSSGMFRR
ncbi:hypothetical protein GOBAR_DD08771 [Gossypium barbadense]|nr:hypothetical protein GOBAR_DD08771 [Gossypium barbadense]